MRLDQVRIEEMRRTGAMKKKKIADRAKQIVFKLVWIERENGIGPVSEEDNEI